MIIEKSRYRKHTLIFLIIVILTTLTVVVSLGIGDYALSYNNLIPTFLGQGSFKDEFVLFELRLPRMAITILSGMALALSGSILQGLTKNDLADPGIIGINSGAGVAVTILFMYMPIDSKTFSYLIPIIAFIGALITAIIIYFLSYKKNEGTHPIRLVLLGVGLSTALSGLMIVMMSIADRTKVDFISKWLVGTVWGVDWVFVMAIFPWIVILVPYVLYKANTLNIIKLSRDVSISVGMSIEKERLKLLLASVALSSFAVSVTGNISFIGLMAPHISKALVGHRNQLFIPISTLIGGWLLLLADTIGQHLLPSSSIPAGIVVSIIGAPYFIYLLLKNKK
ncbi:FecCD family ABC transporter permease [Clostridium felsineum]|uniref:FecCD family ABC transporter permease n=1 Tax=Clostridium felsineum TaxID=36839 RepID=UPI00098C4308|nr:iron ABC transporter permease [Clostridium felsineum]URZ01569.1 putative siderophore transport system permease protein YfhA [Clostridium felsineum]